MILQIELLSDLCAASGNGHAGYIDTDINYNATTGLPYLPSKRIKGCLREAALDVLSFYGNEAKEREDAFDALFGLSGKSIGGSLKISDGILNRVISENTDFNKFDVLDALTTTRYATQMEDGPGLIRKGKDKSFRTTRVVNKGEVFFCTIHFSVDDPELVEKYEAFLKQCCAMLKNMGTNRTRGWGEVRCTLLPKVITTDGGNAKDEENQQTAFTTHPLGTKHVVSYKITLEEPVVSAPLSGEDGCEGYLPGSMLLGYFANRWVKTNSNESEPHKNAEFKRLFLEGGVNFGGAYHGCGKPYYPASVCIKTNKTNDEAYDECIESPNNDSLRLLPRKLGGFVDIEQDGETSTLKVANVKYDIALHHARPSDRGIGHAQKSTDTGNSGGLFNYKALSANQTFYGSIVGTKKDLEKLQSLVEPHIRLGRSRTAQYGNARFEWLSGNVFLSNENIDIQPGEKVRVLVKSPLILCTSTGTITPDVDILAKELELEIVKSSTAEDMVAGYNAKWLLPRAQMRCIKPGGAIIMENTGTVAWSKQQEQFIGLRTSEGFGHITIEKLPPHGDLLKPESVSTTEATRNNALEKCELPQKSLDKIISFRRETLDWQQKGWEHGKKFWQVNGDANTPANSQLARLITTVNLVSKENYPFKGLERELQDDKPEWKIEKNRKKIQQFCKYKELLTKNWSWDCYKTWLFAAINCVKHERRKINAE